MSHVEVEANSIDEAIEQALRQLGVPREKAEIEILANSARGLFGLGGRKAKVRATVRSALRLSDELDPTETAQSEERPKEESSQPARVAPRPAPVDLTALAQTGAILQEMLRRMGIEAQVEAATDGRLMISGDSSGILIGRRGQTLDAIEYVINRIASRDEDKSGRIVVDTENYRERRRQSLEAMAKRLADRARRRGKPVTLSPMSPRDRRIVHLALQGDASLTTRSTGEGFFRRLVIVPANARGNRRGGDRRTPARIQRQENEA
jgi:spoIIIJ-associated protein